jgi:hypothetical protein
MPAQSVNSMNALTRNIALKNTRPENVSKPALLSASSNSVVRFKTDIFSSPGSAVLLNARVTSLHIKLNYLRL